MKMVYNHLRLCLFSVPLKPLSHPDSETFLRRTELDDDEGTVRLSECLKRVGLRTLSLHHGLTTG